VLLRTIHGDVRYQLAGDIIRKRGTSIDVPTTGSGRTNDYKEISDDELRLLGWILTDGCITGGIRIYQSKQDGIDNIKELLTRMGIEHTFTIRKPRNISPIGGVEVKTHYLREYSI